MGGSRNSFHPIPLSVWGGRRRGKAIYCLWLYEAAKVLFAQPTDSIYNSEEMVLLGIWYIGSQYIYTIYSAVEMQYFEKVNSA